MMEYPNYKDKVDIEYLFTFVIIVDEQTNELVTLRIFAMTKFQIAKIFLTATKNKITDKNLKKIWWDECKKNIIVKKFRMPCWNFSII